MFEAKLTSSAVQNAGQGVKLAAIFIFWLCAASGVRAEAYVIDDFEFGTPFYLFESGPNSEIHFPPAENVQTGLPVFSGIRQVHTSGGLSTASWGSAELASTPGDDGIRFSGVGGSGVVWYRSQIDPYHGMDFDALAVGDRFYVKLSGDPGAVASISFGIQDQDAGYGFGAGYLDGSGYLEFPFAAWPSDATIHPDFHHISAFSFQVNIISDTTSSVTVTEFGIIDVPEPASAMLLAAGGFAMLLCYPTVRRRLRERFAIGPMDCSRTVF